MKRLYISLTNKSSIDKTIEELERLKGRIGDREELFCRRLADIGVNAAMLTLAFKGQGDADRSASFNVSFEAAGEEVTGTITVTSTPHTTKDGRTFYPHLAWEFSAGNYFNGSHSNSPYANKLGMGVGTFPNQTHVPNPGFWYYRDENGDAVRSYGTQGTQPMHTAFVEMMNNIEAVAHEVYGGI